MLRRAPAITHEDAHCQVAPVDLEGRLIEQMTPGEPEDVLAAVDHRGQ